MPQPKNTPAPEAPAAKLEKGDHNPFLEGLIGEGAEINKAIHEWYEQRTAVRDQARAAVKTGFCSKEQADRVEELFPMPKRKGKGEGENSQEAPQGE